MYTWSANDINNLTIIQHSCLHFGRVQLWHQGHRPCSKFLPSKNVITNSAFNSQLFRAELSFFLLYMLQQTLWAARKQREAFLPFRPSPLQSSILISCITNFHLEVSFSTSVNIHLNLSSIYTTHSTWVSTNFNQRYSQLQQTH